MFVENCPPRETMDSGFLTWRISKNLVIYDEERNCINNETEKERFFDLRVN